MWGMKWSSGGCLLSVLTDLCVFILSLLCCVVLCRLEFDFFQESFMLFIINFLFYGRLTAEIAYDPCHDLYKLWMFFPTRLYFSPEFVFVLARIKENLNIF